LADTRRGDFPKEKCDDCGRPGCCFQHWGSLVPNGESGNFCIFCWEERQRRRGGTPLGIKPPGVPEQFLDKAITVTTKSGSIYKFGLPNEKGLRSISYNKAELGFERCDIICLVIGRPFFLRPHDFGENCSPFHARISSPVVLIEQTT